MFDLRTDPDFLLVSERYQRIGMGIEVRWGTADLDPYLNNLLNDTRDHTRHGFPAEVGKALSALLLQHAKLFPQYIPPPKSVWDINFSA